jgi:iron complex transport system permease protein
VATLEKAAPGVPEQVAGTPRRSLSAALRERAFLILALAFLLALLLSLLVGRYPSPYWLSPARLFHDEMAQRLILNLRLPRVLMAALLGVMFAAAGTVFQMLFRNPLVEPGFLGVSQGAAFGAAFSIIFLGGSRFLTGLSATLCAAAGLAGSYLIARKIRYGGWILRLVLAGIAVSALFSSGVGVLKYLADPLTQLPDIVFWMRGGLWGVTWAELWRSLPLILPGLAIILMMRWRLNLLALGDETALSLGASPGRERAVLLAASVAAVAAIVSVAGVVGWIGLIVPHAARRLFGADARRALPGSMLLGGIFGLVSDSLARTLLPGEIPLGILTSLFGALLFILLMTARGASLRRRGVAG